MKKPALTPTQTHYLNVQYSAINHDLTVHNKYEVQATEGKAQTIAVTSFYIYSIKTT